MKKLYYYRIKDIEDSELFSEYYVCDKECGTLIKKAIKKYHDNNDIGENVFYYIEEFMKENNINFELLKFKDFEF